jgi:putative SOS response-associated peptidase YedK
MCGRFSLTGSERALETEFGAAVPAGYRPRYNIAPTQGVLALLPEGGRHWEILRWGLIPSWAKDPEIGTKLINARAETLFEKPSFRAAVKQRRCLVIADGFYEWRKTEEGRKIPFYIRLKSQKPFGLAGLWESWKSPGGEMVKTCTIVTTEPNELLKPIHSRMPVMVPKDTEPLWLEARVRSKAELERVLQPYPAAEMELFEVAPLVNSPANDRPECVQPVKP